MAISLRPNLIIFDFDGVVVDSAGIKLDAYRSVYASEASDKIRQVLEYAVLHGGITRRKNFIYYERELFNRSADAATIDRLSQAYFDLVYQAVLMCPFIAGAEELLRRADRKIKMHVVSGTPETELVEIVEKRGLSRFFRSVQGAPTTKPDAFAQIVADEGEPRERVLAIGDSITEYLAAQEIGIAFLGVVPQGAVNPFPADVVVRPSLENADELLGIR